MDSETARTFGIKTIAPWIIQANNKVQITEEVGGTFIQSCHTARIKKHTHPFYQEA
jgi:hypothetical protein